MESLCPHNNFLTAPPKAEGEKQRKNSNKIGSRKVMHRRIEMIKQRRDHELFDDTSDAGLSRYGNFEDFDWNSVKITPWNNSSSVVGKSSFLHSNFGLCPHPSKEASSAKAQIQVPNKAQKDEQIKESKKEGKQRITSLPNQYRKQKSQQQQKQKVSWQQAKTFNRNNYRQIKPITLPSNTEDNKQQILVKLRADATLKERTGIDWTSKLKKQQELFGRIYSHSCSERNRRMRETGVNKREVEKSMGNSFVGKIPMKTRERLRVAEKEKEKPYLKMKEFLQEKIREKGSQQTNIKIGKKFSKTEKKLQMLNFQIPRTPRQSSNGEDRLKRIDNVRHSKVGTTPQSLKNKLAAHYSKNTTAATSVSNIKDHHQQGQQIFNKTMLQIL